LFLWTLGNVLRAWATGAPAEATVRSGAEFLVFPLLLPSFVAAGQDPKLRRQLIVGFGLLTVWVIVTNIAAGLGAISSPGGDLAHTYRATPTGGIVRVWALSQDIPVAALPFALGATLLAGTWRGRTVAVTMLLGCLVEIVLSLTRAAYAGAAIMTVIMLATWGRQYLPRIMAVAAVMAVVVAAATQWGPLVTPLHEVSIRVESIFSSTAAGNYATGGDTLTYRQRVESAIRESTSTAEWIVGRGFLPSPWYTFSPDPTGSLQDSDLGWYNALTTMGLVGAGLVVLPVLLCLVACWRARRKATALGWLVFGGMGYAIYALVVSDTLVTLFSPSGLACAGTALGLSLAAALTAAGQSAPTEIGGGVRQPSAAGWVRP
jgi:ABC-type transport system involved in multi-copper enzyme maturation permease subunit